MRPRCASCGARLDEDGTCPRCELEPVPLEDADLGIRREDRYVALPPGPRWVRRRVRRESSVGPFVALAAAIGVLGLMVVLAPGDDTPARTAPQTPLLRDATGVVLLRAGPWGVEEIDLDAGTIRSAEPGAMPPPPTDLVDLESPVVVQTARVEVSRSRCDDEPCLLIRTDDRDVLELTRPVVATRAPDGSTFALLGLDRSMLIEAADGIVTTIAAGAAPRDVTAWSPDSRWLFVATREGGVDAIRRDGERFRVPIGSRVTDRLAVADDASPGDH